MPAHTQIYKPMYSILVVFAPAAVPAVIGILWGACVAPPYFLIDCNIFSIVSGATGYVS